MRNRFVFLPLFLVVLPAPTSLTAQARFGLKAGVSLVNIHYTGIEDHLYYTAALQENSKPLPAFFIGGIAELDWAKNLTLSAELQLAGKGFHLETTDPAADYTNYYARFWYVQLPLAVNFRWNGFFAGAGPYLGLGVAGTTKSSKYFPTNNTTVDTKSGIGYGGSSSDKFSLFDYGLHAQAGYSFRNFRLFLSYGFGLADIVPSFYTDSASARHRILSVSAAYYLGVGE